MKLIVLLRWVVVTCIMFIMLGCTSTKNNKLEFSDQLETLKGDGNVTRTLLTHEFLKKGTRDTIVDYENYAIPDNAAFPTNRFEGRLKLIKPESSGKFKEILDRYNYTDSADVARMHLPPFDYEFVQSGSHIIPLERGYLENEHATWEYILEPGRVWDEKDDADFSRVAIPFTLKQKNQNCVHNGVMMFLFKEDGSITHVSYQIASETCAYFQFNMWGTVEAVYEPNKIERKDEFLKVYASEVTSRMPTKSISKLSEDYPGAKPTEFGFPADLNPEHLTLYGFVIDGTNYVGGCDTRYGTYPFCEVLVVPSYSTAKSLSAGIGLMRLEKEYPGSKNASIKSYIDACDDSIWEDVRFENALDMATGNYENKEAFQDEYSRHINRFFAAEEHKGKIEYSCDIYIRQEAPGQQWVYHTSDTYIVGTAMNQYLREKTNNPKADYFSDLIVNDILKPLGTSPTFQKQQRTYDDVAQPFSGFGLFYHPDDVAKIGQFLNRGAMLANREMLDKEMLSEILSPVRDSSFVASKEDLRYDNGFWFFDLKDSDICSPYGLIPYAAGYGGIKIILLPNDTVYYYFSDHFDNIWKEAVNESNRIRPFCDDTNADKKS